jgi:hypothetical protein
VVKFLLQYLICWGFLPYISISAYQVWDLRHLVKSKRPNLLFLIETKVKQEKMNLLRMSLGFEGMLAVDPVGRSGGIALLWTDSREVTIQNYSRHHINAVIQFVDSDQSWKLTAFYGHPNFTHRVASWQLLSPPGWSSTARLALLG